MVKECVITSLGIVPVLQATWGRPVLKVTSSVLSNARDATIPLSSLSFE